MYGIVDLEVYVPKHRIRKSIINEVWNGVSRGAGKLSFGYFDEDAITMAVQAGINMSSIEHVDACVLATTSSPFNEESAASIVAYTLGLNDRCRTFNLNQATTGGLVGLSLFDEASNDLMLLLASEVRRPAQGSTLETYLGDAAAAVLLGKEHVVAEVVDQYSINDFGYYTWKNASDDAHFIADEKFSKEIRIQQYIQSTADILKQNNLKMEDIQHLIIADIDQNMQRKVAHKLGCPELSVQQSVQSETGYTGTSMPFILLSEVLHQANPGDYVLCLQAGTGVQAVLFKVTENVRSFQSDNQFMKQIDLAMEVERYDEYLHRSGQLDTNSLKPFSSLTYLRRERNANLRLEAQECNLCGEIHFPHQPVCRNCKQRLGDKFKRLKKVGKIFTFTHDYLFPGTDYKVTMTVVDVEDGGRIFTQLTDCDHADVAINKEVQLVFRKLHDGSDYPNYFWKSVLVD